MTRLIIESECSGEGVIHTRARNKTHIPLFRAILVYIREGHVTNWVHYYSHKRSINSLYNYITYISDYPDFALLPLEVLQVPVYHTTCGSPELICNILESHDNYTYIGLYMRAFKQVKGSRYSKKKTHNNNGYIYILVSILTFTSCQPNHKILIFHP